jgi:hypothetical protein
MYRDGYSANDERLFFGDEDDEPQIQMGSGNSAAAP